MSYTPGPWRSRWMVSSYEFVVSDQRGEAIAWIDRVSPADRGEANARLIAAAPDLLEALRIAAIWTNPNSLGEPSPEEYAAVLAAIAQAEGRE